MAGESQRTHRPQFRCASKKLSKNSEADKPLIGVGFGDPGPTYGRRVRRIPVSMLRYVHSDCSPDSLGGLLAFQTPQLSFDLVNSVLRNYSRDCTRSGGLKTRRATLTPSGRRHSPKSVDEDNVDRGNIENALWESDRKSAPYSRRVVLEKCRGLRPGTAGFASEDRQPLHKHNSEEKLSNRLFQNDSLQVLVPTDAPVTSSISNPQLHQ